MLSHEQLSLITAAVDGELNRSESARLRKLFECSSEAVELFEQLRNDRARLQTLPRAVPPVHLQQRVMARIAALTPPPGSLPCLVASPSTLNQPRATPAPDQLPPGLRRRQFSKAQRWVPVAIAASVLFALCGISYLFFSHGPDKAKSVARNSSRPISPAGSRAGDHDWSNWLPPEQGPLPAAPTPVIVPVNDLETARSGSPLLKNEAAETNSVAVAPAPRASRNQAIVGSEIRPEIAPLDLVRVRVPFLKPLAEFDREDVRQQCLDELNRDPAFRIDLFTRHLPHACELFHAAAKNAGVTVHLDPLSLDRVARAQVSAVAIYTESLTSSELTDLLARLAVEDAKISPRVFDVVHAAPIVQSDQESLRNFLGLDPGLFKRPNPEKPHEAGKAISDGTADQIVKSLKAGQGKAGEKSALLMTWLPLATRTPPALSTELKQFLLKRGERKASVVPAIIVIRYRNG